MHLLVVLICQHSVIILHYQVLPVLNHDRIDHKTKPMEHFCPLVHSNISVIQLLLYDHGMTYHYAGKLYWYVCNIYIQKHLKFRKCIACSIMNMIDESSYDYSGSVSLTFNILHNSVFRPVAGCLLTLVFHKSFFKQNHDKRLDCS